QTPDELAGTLRQMETLGLLINDTQLTLYLRHGVTNSSEIRLKRILELEKSLFELLSEEAPDAESGEWQDLSLTRLATVLQERTGNSQILPVQVLAQIGRAHV